MANFRVNVGANDVSYSSGDGSQSVTIADITQAMKKARFVDIVANILLIVGAFFLVGTVGEFHLNWLIIGAIGAVVGGVLKCLARLKLPVRLEFNLEGEGSQLFEAWRAFLASEVVWEISEETAIADQRTNSGADLGFKRTEVKRIKAPFYIATSAPVLCIKSKSKKIIILPENVLITQKGGEFEMIEYIPGQIRAYKERFVESGVVPSDTEVVGQTYRYVNKDGSPDGRYSENPAYSVCLYGYVEIIGLGVKLSCSNPEGVNGFNSN